MGVSVCMAVCAFNEVRARSKRNHYLKQLSLVTTDG